MPDLLYNKLLKNEMELMPLPPLDSETTDENTPEFKKEVFIAKKYRSGIYKKCLLKRICGFPEVLLRSLKNIQAIEQEQEDNLNEAHEKVLR